MWIIDIILFIGLVVLYWKLESLRSEFNGYIEETNITLSKHKRMINFISRHVDETFIKLDDSVKGVIDSTKKFVDEISESNERTISVVEKSNNEILEILDPILKGVADEVVR